LNSAPAQDSRQGETIAEAAFAAPVQTADDFAMPVDDQEDERFVLVHRLLWHLAEQRQHDCDPNGRPYRFWKGNPPKPNASALASRMGVNDATVLRAIWRERVTTSDDPRAYDSVALRNGIMRLTGWSPVQYEAELLRMKGTPPPDDWEDRRPKRKREKREERSRRGRRRASGR
jgi:hypothetical protein